MLLIFSYEFYNFYHVFRLRAKTPPNDPYDEDARAHAKSHNLAKLPAHS